MSRWKAAAVMTAVAALAAGGGAARASAVQSQGSPATVKVKLFEFKLIPSAGRVTAAKVTFVVSNTGKIKHEFVVLRTGTPAGKLPVQSARASEPGKVGEIAAFDPGKTKTLTLTLKPGHYALICNLPGHYQAGQWADFTVR